jgi:hypothetical protein
MATQQLLSQSGVAAPAAGGTGPITAFPGSDGIRVIQVNPAAGTPFTGTVEIRGTNKPAPGANDFAVIASIDFSGHVGPFTLYIQNGSTSVRAIITSVVQGQVAIFADSNNGALVGGSGTTLAQSTAVVSSQNKTTVNGPFVHVASATVPSITSDDVTYAVDFNETTTDVLVRYGATLDAITTAGVVVADLNLLAGQNAYGLTVADLNKLADISASASEVNFSVGVTSGIQAQLDAKADGAGVNITGLTVTAGSLNTFFDVPPTVAVSFLNGAFTGLIATSGDLNALAATAGQVTAADIIKLGDITASAIEINVLNGLTATAANLNVLTATTASAADVNAVTGLAGLGIEITELQHLVGLTENVQTALDTITPLGGLTSSVSDLNVLTGVFAATGAFSGGAISSAEIAHLNGVTANIQATLDSKRDNSATIGIAEITGSSISTVELNYLSGSTSNIQTQLDALSGGSITASGGTFTGAINIAAGTFAAPGLGYAGATTTGLSLFGGSGVGVSVAGVRAASLDGSSLIIGDALTSGQPLATHSGMGVSTPTWSFVGDTDSGLYRVGIDSVGIGAGGANLATFDANGAAIVLGGAIADNVSVSVTGLFQGEKVLGTATVTAGATSAVAPKTFPIYTVPVARTAVITKIFVRLTAAVVGAGGFIAGPPGDNTLRLNIGFTGATFDEIVDNVSNTAIWNPTAYDFSTASQVMPLGVGDNTFPAISGASGADYGALTAGAVLTAHVGTLANLDTFTLEITAFGYEV